MSKVLIVDDHPAVREGLAIRLSRQPDLKVCGQAADISRAMKLVASTHPDIVIVDISLKNGNGIDLIKRIKASGESIRMLVWSMYSESLCAERALRAGAMGYINKGQETDDIIEAIRAILKEGLFQRKTGRARAAPGNWPCRGRSAAIARRKPLGARARDFRAHRPGPEQRAEIKISPKTVQTYRARVKQKLRIARGPQLVQRAVEWVLQNN